VGAAAIANILLLLLLGSMHGETVKVEWRTTPPLLPVLGDHHTPDRSDTAEGEKYRSVTTTTTTSSTTRRRVQKVAILPGPHKTGTTSVQDSFRKWIRWTKQEEEMPSPLNDWAWPVPTPLELRSIHAGKVPGGNKGFALLGTRLFGSLRFGGQATTEDVLSLYRKKFQDAWKEGKHIVLAAEFLDVMASETATLQTLNATSGIELLHRLLDLLPSHPMVIREVLVVVHHREPRVEHLLSLWHQLGKSKTLSEYILDERGGLSKSAFKLNSMGLADVFVQEGLPVHIMDTAGAKRTQVDLPTGVVCHALEVSSCRHYPDGRVTLEGVSGNATSEFLNKKPDGAERDLKEEILNRIDQLMNDYDCQFQYFQDHPTVKLHFAEHMFRTCSPTNHTNSDQERYPFSHTIQEIIDLVVCEQAHDCTPA
jgi:hypothetical protein